MGIDLGGIQMFMPQDLLYGFYIHTVLQHQCGRRVTQLMAGVLGSVQSRHSEVLLYQGMNHGTTDALIAF